MEGIKNKSSSISIPDRVPEELVWFFISEEQVEVD